MPISKATTILYAIFDLEFNHGHDSINRRQCAWVHSGHNAARIVRSGQILPRSCESPVGRGKSRCGVTADSGDECPGDYIRGVRGRVAATSRFCRSAVPTMVNSPAKAQGVDLFAAKALCILYFLQLIAAELVTPHEGRAIDHRKIPYF
jgi:hypothetical protein